MSKCNRCGWKRPNPYCYVCRQPEPEPDRDRETTDSEGTSLMKTLARLTIALAYYASIIGIIFFAANTGGKEAIWCLFAAMFFAFLRVVLATDDHEENDREWADSYTHPRL